MTLGGADNGAVYTALSSRQVPFMFLTGYDTHELLREWASVPILAKPAGEAELVAKVEALLNPGDASQDDVREPTSRTQYKQRIVCCGRPRWCSTRRWAVPPAGGDRTKKYRRAL